MWFKADAAVYYIDLESIIFACFPIAFAASLNTDRQKERCGPLL